MRRPVLAFPLRARGFTLSELMVAMTIIGILLAVAAPSYNEYLVRARRGSAKAVLLEIASRQEQYAVSNRAFVDAATTALVESSLKMEIPSDAKIYYDFKTERQDVAGGTGNGFSATATPVAGGTQVADGVLSINQFGLKLPTGKW